MTEPRSSHRKLVHETRIVMRWGDMDAVGHLNNTVYFRFMEQARVEWLHKMGLPLADDAEGVLIVSASCNFRRAVNYPATIDVRMFAGAPGRSSFPTYYELRDASEPHLVYADGEATAVWVDYRTDRSRPMPDELRAYLSATG